MSKKSVIGICGICKTIGPLTKDHVPIQSVMPNELLELTTLPEYLNKDLGLMAKRRRSFRAPKYPTLCRRCNNDLLGARYDLEMKSFSRDVMNGLRAHAKKIIMPRGLPIKTKPMWLARAIIGHLLAAETRNDPNELIGAGNIYESMRSFFLDENSPWPQNLYFALWPYNDKKTFIARGFGLCSIRTNPPSVIVGDLMKYTPLAFWISENNPFVFPYGLTALPLGPELSINSRLKFELGLTISHASIGRKLRGTTALFSL